MSEQLSPEVRAFIHAYIDSLEQLEVLLALRSDPMKAWTPVELSVHLRLAPESVTTRLKALLSFGFLVEADGRYRFAPKSTEMVASAAAVSRAYAERKFTVVHEIFSRPSDVVSIFANAFKIRRGDE